MRRPSLTAAVVAVGVCLIVAGVAMAQVSSTRVSQFDWRCESATGATISDHQRFDTAFVACLNSPDGAYVQGGRYRITRPAPVAGTATLLWTPPTQNTDGTPLADLAGYRIHYGLAAGELTQVIQIASPGASSYTVRDLAPGTHYFAVRAYTSGGKESDTSNVVSKVVM